MDSKHQKGVSPTFQETIKLKPIITYLYMVPWDER